MVYRVKAICNALCPMVRPAGTDWALMKNDYRNDRLTYVVGLLYYHTSQTKTLFTVWNCWKKNSSSCDKLMWCLWMIFAHFAVSAVGSEGKGHNDYILKIITGFWNIQLMSLSSFWIDMYNTTYSRFPYVSIWTWQLAWIKLDYCVASTNVVNYKLSPPIVV